MAESAATCEFAAGPDSVISGVLADLQHWCEERDYAGYEPYDVLNSPMLASVWQRSRVLSSATIQLGKRFGGVGLRRVLRVRASKNPKALGLFLAGYCDLARCGQDVASRASYLKRELQRLSAPGEPDFSWGYDWNYVSLRGPVLSAFSPNSIATVFGAEALYDMANVFRDAQAAEMAESACRFCVTRLNRSWDTADEVCFSYTPDSRTLIFNNSALVGTLLARAACNGYSEYMDLACRAMRYLAARQRNDGAWPYGEGRLLKWVDSFHTGYNLSALVWYRTRTGDRSFDAIIERGYRFYRGRCFTREGVPRYFQDSTYPIDIHACAQAVLTLCDFATHDYTALELAVRVAHWTIRNMRAQDGSFYYQRHRLWTDRTPYMRWGQAWMFRALARLMAATQGYSDKK